MTRTCAICGAEGAPEAVSCRQCGATLAGSGGWHWSEAEADEAPAGGLPAGPYHHDAAEGLPARNLLGLLKETWACSNRHPMAFFFLGLLSQGPSFLLGAIAEEVPWVLYLLLVPVETLLSALIIFATARDQAGQEVEQASVASVLPTAARRLPALLGSGLISVALLGISVLLIPLFVYLLVGLYFYSQAIMIEGAGPVAALRRSHAMVKGSWWRVFGLGLAFMLLFAVPEWVVGVFGRTPGLFVGALMTVLEGISATLLYLDLRVRKEGCTAERLAWELGGRVGAPPALPGPEVPGSVRPGSNAEAVVAQDHLSAPHERRRRAWWPLAIVLLAGAGVLAVAGAFAVVKVNAWLQDILALASERAKDYPVVADAYAAYWASPRTDGSSADAGQRYALLKEGWAFRAGAASELRELQAIFTPVVPDTPELAALQRQGLVGSIGLRYDWGSSRSAFDVMVVRAVVPGGRVADARLRGEIIARLVAGIDPLAEGDLLIVSLVQEEGPGKAKCAVARLGALGREEAAQRAYESWEIAGGVRCA